MIILDLIVYTENSYKVNDIAFININILTILTPTAHDSYKMLIIFQYILPYKKSPNLMFQNKNQTNLHQA